LDPREFGLAHYLRTPGGCDGDPAIQSSEITRQLPIWNLSDTSVSFVQCAVRRLGSSCGLKGFAAQS
jgi:hypothetical protein